MMATQESGKAHPPGSGWPVEPTKQADAQLLGIWHMGAWAGHSDS